MIETGITRCYPAENKALADDISRRGAVLSQFWPTRPPGRVLQKTSPSDADTRRGEPAQGLFVTRPDISLRGRRVLLIDDTYTSGSTLRSAGLAVIRAGGRPVAVTIGRQVRNDTHGSHIVADALVSMARLRSPLVAI